MCFACLVYMSVGKFGLHNITTKQQISGSTLKIVKCTLFIAWVIHNGKQIICFSSAVLCDLVRGYCAYITRCSLSKSIKISEVFRETGKFEPSLQDFHQSSPDEWVKVIKICTNLARFRVRNGVNWKNR